ncbi:MAG: DUF1648 domain-containing protein [bacterium]|nr:DUF1648 domain-containing protein [bacterium]
MKEKTSRSVLGIVIPVAVAAIGLVPYRAYRSDLPDRIASHFGVSGRADGSMTPEVFLVIVGALMAIGLGACVTMGVTRRRFQPMVAPSVSAVGAFFGSVSAGILAITAISQRGLEQWQDATLSPWAVIALIIGSVALAGLAAWIASSLPHQRQAGTDAAPPAIALSPGERVFWSATLSARWPLVLGLAILLVGLALLLITELWIGLVMLGISILMTFFGRIRVTADRSGLSVRYGVLGWPRRSIPIRRIAAARAVDIRPTEWGGWGYRGSLAIMRRAAVVLRAGPGIRLDLRDGKVFAVTIDDPEDPVRLLNAEISRHAAPNPASGRESIF